MRGSTPKARANVLERLLKRTYDKYAQEENVINMLADLRHLCDAKGWSFADLDRQAYDHYLVELHAGTVGKGE